jgi:hypothetical protein
MNALYDKGRQKFLEGAVAWLTDDIKCCLVNGTDYTVNLGSDEFLSDIPGAAIIATSGNLASKTSTGGVADAADINFTAVSGDQIDAIVIYKDTGSDATSPLLLYCDSGVGLPFTPIGSDILLGWENGSTKIFKL